MHQDYFTDTPYTWGFYGDFGPLNLSYVARLCGLEPVDVTRPFRFLELGCGNGVSLNTFAACHPESEFVGVDLNPEHVSNATRLAREGELPNVRFEETTFADFLESDAGSFDFVALHGVYSWVGPDVRREIRDIIDRKLRPGGYAYVSYNAMPGWAAILPLRQIMLSYTSGLELPTIERVRRGLQYLSFLRDNGAGYFANNTAAHQRLDMLLKYDPRYVAHEFFPKYWSASYFEEVAGDLRSCGLSFAGSIPACMNVRELSVPKKFQDLLRTAPNRGVYETHKSFVLNEMFRRDLYVKPPVAQPDPAAVEAWDDLAFGALVEPRDLRLQVRLPAGEVTYSGPIYPVLTGILLDRAMRFGDLRADPRLAAWEPAHVLHSLHMLCAGGQFGVLLRTPPPPAAAETGRWRFAHPFPRALLQQRLLSDGRVSLASPVTGNGVTVDLIAGLAALAFDQAPEGGAEAWALDLLKRNGHHLHVDGKPVVGDDAQLAVLSERFARFRTHSLPSLARYGILEPR